MQTLSTSGGLAAQLPLFVCPAQPFDVHATSVPARTFTGDFFVSRVIDDRLSLVVGDVAGKGLHAAVFMAMVQEELEHHIDEDPSATVRRLDRVLLGALPPNRFVTVVAATLRADGRLDVANGGHCPPLLLRRDGSVEAIGSTGPVAGLLPAARWTTTSRRIEAGDALLLYSDGVIESRSPDGEEFGVERLAAAARGDTAQAIARSVLRAVQAFGAPEDDLTVLVARR